MKRKAIVLAFSVSVLSGFQTAAKAADADAGRDAFETCRGCHSAVSYSNVYPTYYVPKIGGQVPAYTVAALKAYKESARSHRTMMANSFDLSEEKMEDIAAHIERSNGSKQTRSNLGDVAEGKKLAATCLSCHNDDTSPGAANPRLAGQHANYLERAIKDYQLEKRKNPLMKSMVDNLSEDEIKDISAYFASLKGLTSTK